MSSDWLQNLKEGDQVVLKCGSRLFLTPVTLVTSTQVMCGDCVFSRKTGEEIAASWVEVAYLYPATPERVAEIAARDARQDMLVKIKDGIKSLSTDQLRRLVAIVEENDGNSQ